jgi:hypothetical protein
MPDINLSPFNAEQAAMDRRRKMAEALQQQAIAPIEMPTVPGAKVSHYQGLAKLLQGYIAGKEFSKADQEQKDYENQVSEDQAKFLRNMGQYETVPGEVISRGTETTYPMKENTTPLNQNVPAVDLSAEAMPVAGQPEQRTPDRQIPILNASLLESTNPLAFKTGQGKQMLAQYLMQQEAQKQAAAQAELAASRQIHTLNPEQTAGRFVNGQFVPLVTGKPKDLTDYQNYQLQIQNNANAIAATNAQDKSGLTVNPEALQINPKIKGVPPLAKKTNRIDVKTKKPIYTFNGEDYIED